MTMHEDATEEISEAELLQMFGEQWMRNLHVAIPAKVEAFDASKQTVDVTPQLNRSLPDGAGNYVTEQLPKIKDVPINYPRTTQFMMAFPIPVGDFGLLIVCDRNLAQWRATAAQGDPGDLALHSLDGAVFIPGLFPDNKPAQNVNGTNMVIGSDTDGPSRIEITPSSGGKLGAGATDGVMTADDGRALYQAINNAGVLPNDGGAAFKANLLLILAASGWGSPLAPVNQLASSKWKAVR